jgi:hypothetical protein
METLLMDVIISRRSPHIMIVGVRLISPGLVSWWRDRAREIMAF